LAHISTTTVLSSGQVSDRPETLDRKVSKGCESTGFEETCRSGERRGQETLAEHIRAKYGCSTNAAGAGSPLRNCGSRRKGALRPSPLDYDLDEYTFRFNRRTSRSRGKLFYRLVQPAVAIDPVPARQIGAENADA